jgi:hypothetical protein
VHVSGAATWITNDENGFPDLCPSIADKQDFIQYSKHQNHQPINQQDDDEQQCAEQAPNAEMLNAIQVDELKKNFYPNVKKRGMQKTH